MFVEKIDMEDEEEFGTNVCKGLLSQWITLKIIKEFVEENILIKLTIRRV